MVGTVFSLADPVFARLLFAVHIGWFTLARTDAWREFCRWFMALPLT
jgi:hypothetical protein